MTLGIWSSVETRPYPISIVATPLAKIVAKRQIFRQIFATAKP
jgi:hypothetical protein